MNGNLRKCFIGLRDMNNFMITHFNNELSKQEMGMQVKEFIKKISK